MEKMDLEDTRSTTI